MLKHLLKYTSRQLVWTIVLLWSSFYLLEIAGQSTTDCSAMPCQNGATCIDLPDGYNCTCLPGYTGEQCDTDVDDCESRPCMNNGICLDGINSFTCQCITGFIGELCEIRDACFLYQPCPNNSTCVVNGTGNYFCVCPPDYTGEFCSMRIDDCASVPCMNGGNCTDEINNFTCSCSEGYEGIRCEIDKDVCEESTCANNGTCIEGIGDAFHCECLPEFTSPDCSVPLGICDLLMPCQNNATCSDVGDDDYTCHCLPGFALKNCTATTNNCMDSSCLNGGVCIDQSCPIDTNCFDSDSQNFSCICPEIFMGPDCSVINCSCQNGGICSVGVNDTIQCNCLLGWTGMLCEIEINIEVPAFNGNGYLQYSPLNQRDPSVTVINLALRTAQPDGQLLYNGQDDSGQGDYIQLRVAGGFLQLRVNFGSRNTDVESSVRVDDNEWHFVEIRVDNTTATFTLDNTTRYSSIISGRFTSLQLFGSLYLGGIASSITVQPDARNTPAFIGCISEFEEDERNSSELVPIGGLNVVNCNISMCQDFVCENGGSCILDPSNQLEPTCSCPEGFTGDRCDTALYMCATDPCLHGSTCVPIGDTGYRCICQLGYTGINCETALDISVPQFFNTSYIRYITEPSVTLRSTVIEIDIKPAQNFSTGILLYTSQSSNIDYFLLALNTGRVLFQFNCGSGHGTVESMDQLLAGVWHKVQVQRTDNMANLTVNSAASEVTYSRGTFSSLNLNNRLYVGGLPSGHILPSSVTITTGFDGCVITNFTLAGNSGQSALIERDSSALVSECGVAPCLVNPCINGGTCDSIGSSVSCICPPSFLPPICNISRPDPCISDNPCSNGSTCISLLDGSIQCLCPFQSIGPSCNSTEAITVPSFRKTDYSYISFPTPAGVFATSTITFSFLPYAPEGVLFYSAYRPPATTADFISLAMKNGYLEFRYNLGSGSNPIRSSSQLTLGQWYDVYASRTGRTGNLTIVGVSTTIGTSPGVSSYLDLTTHLFVGGAPDYRMLANDVGVYTGLDGCIHNLAINDAQYDWADHLMSRDVEQCDVLPPVDPCLQQLGMECQNGGTCMQSNTTGSYVCQCTPDFTGELCETSLACTLVSCRNGGECLFNEMGQGTICSCPIPYAGDDCTNQVTIDVAMFNGQSYIEIRRASIAPSLLVTNSFSLEFRTNSYDGLILWQGLEDGGNKIDFISLGVVKQRLELRFDLGIGAVMVSSNTVVSDGRWHNVTVTRSHGTAYLTLDNESPQDVTSPYTSLDTRSNYWIGGHRDITVTTHERGLVGCIRELFINDEAIDLDDLTIIASSSNVIDCGSL